MGGDTWYEKQKQTVLVLSDSSLLSILFSTSLWHVRFRGPDIQSFGCPSLGKLFPIDSALCWTIEWLGCNEMAANGCRFSDFAFLRLFKCLFWSYLCLLAGYLCLCSRSFLRDFMESLFVAFSQLNPTHKTGCRDSFSILTCMTDSRFLVAGAMPSMIEKHWRSQLERRY